MYTKNSSKGLIVQGRANVTPHKAKFAHPGRESKHDVVNGLDAFDGWIGSMDPPNSTNHP